MLWEWKQQGLDEDLFGLGLNSLSVMKLVSELRSRGVDVSVREAYTAPTVRGIAAAASEDRDVQVQRVVSLIEHDLEAAQPVADAMRSHWSIKKRPFMSHSDPGRTCCGDWRQWILGR